MRITSIEKGKGRRYDVYADGSLYMTLTAAALHDSGLRPGMELMEEALMEIKAEADFRRAKERALYLLEYRDHSYGELVDKLCRSVGEDTALAVADKMTELGFVNDLEYARKLAGQYLIGKKYGKIRARQQMRLKKLDYDIIDRALMEFEEETEIDPVDTVRQLIERKYARYLADEKGRRKTVAALLRMGHSYDTIKQALRDYTDGPSFAQIEMEYEE